jgi:hypothetical protein
MQLRPYLEHFGPERVRVLTFEELTRAPVPTVQSVFAWLGVDPVFVPGDTQSARNATPKEVTQRREGAGLLHRFRHSRLWDLLGRYMPASLRKVGVAMVEKKVERTRVDMSEVKTYLRAMQRPQVETLAGLVGRDFPEWKTLHGR